MAPKSSAHKGTHKKDSHKYSQKERDARDSKKGSKLANLKTAIFGAAKKKLSDVSSALPSASASKTAQKSVKADMKDKDKDHSKDHGKDATAKKAKPATPAAAAPTHSPLASPKKAAALKALTGKNSPGAQAAAALARAKPGSKDGHSHSYSRGGDLGDSVCREVACEGLGTSGGYCRMHYIKNWKKIKRKEVILKEGKLNQYIEELVAKYPDKYIEAIRQDLASEKEFAKVIHDLDLDESVDEFADGEGESLDAVIGDIKRDFDDEGDGF